MKAVFSCFSLFWEASLKSRFRFIKVTQQILCKLLSFFRSHCQNKFAEMASVSLCEFCWFKIVLLLCVFTHGRVPMVACELVPAMFDPETKQVIYNPGQTRTQKKDLVVTIAQDVKTEKKQSNKQIRKLWIKSRVSKQRHPFVWSELSKG